MMIVVSAYGEGDGYGVQLDPPYGFTVPRTSGIAEIAFNNYIIAFNNYIYTRYVHPHIMS